MILSVVIPTYNREPLLTRAIDSVFCQELPAIIDDLEVIIVDDGSDDQTAASVVEKHPHVTYLKQENQGVSAARNLGIASATGEWIALLDSDDEWLPNKLLRQFDALSGSGSSICHTEEIWVRNGVRVNQMNKHKKFGGNIFDKCLPMCAMSPSSIVIHKSVFERVGVFDERLPACEDYDLWLRICAHYSVEYVDQPSIIKYGGHEDQLSRAFWGMDRFRVSALAKLLVQPESSLRLTELQQASVKRVLAKKTKILMKGAQKHQNLELVSRCEKIIKEFNL